MTTLNYFLVQQAALKSGMTLKDLGDTAHGTIRQLMDMIEILENEQQTEYHDPRITDQELLDISDQMPEKEKQIVFERFDENSEEVVMDLGPFITAYSRKVAQLQAGKILQLYEDWLQDGRGDDRDPYEFDSVLREFSLLGDE